VEGTAWTVEEVAEPVAVNIVLHIAVIGTTENVEYSKP
jgi:hypothetical protein